MAVDISIGEGLVADVSVVLGYVSERSADGSLVVGDGARLRSGTVLYGGSVIGDRLQTGHHVVIREQNRIGDDVSVWSNSFLDYGCVVGNRVKIHCNCYVAQYTELEDDVFLAPGVTVANDLYPGHPASARAMAGPLVCAGAQIGVNVTLLPYITVGSHAIVGAGSVVTKDIPADTIAYGNPARPVRPIHELSGIAQRVGFVTAHRGDSRHPPRVRRGPATSSSMREWGD